MRSELECHHSRQTVLISNRLCFATDTNAISKNRRIRPAVAVIIGGRGNVRSVVIKIIKKRRDRHKIHPLILFDFNKNLNGNGCSVKFNKGKAVKFFVVRRSLVLQDINGDLFTK